FASVTPIPMSARFGDNVIERSPKTAWYHGPTLLDFLETIEVADTTVARPFRFPVQWVNRPDQSFRGYAGTIAAGSVKPGDAVVVARTGQTGRVARIVTMERDLLHAEAGAAVTLTLDSEIDLSRGDVLSHAETRPEVSDQIAAHMIWMGEEPLLPGRPYLLK